MCGDFKQGLELAVGERHDEFIIERKGKPLAALVPVERLEQMRRFARREALEFMVQQTPSALSDAQAAEVAAEAVRWARRQAPRATRASKASKSRRAAK